MTRLSWIKSFCWFVLDNKVDCSSHIIQKRKPISSITEKNNDPIMELELLWEGLLWLPWSWRSTQTSSVCFRFQTLHWHAERNQTLRDWFIQLWPGHVNLAAKSQENIVRFQNWRNIGKTLAKHWKSIGNSIGKSILEKEIHLPTLESHFIVFQDSFSIFNQPRLVNVKKAQHS